MKIHRKLLKLAIVLNLVSKVMINNYLKNFKIKDNDRSYNKPEVK